MNQLNLIIALFLIVNINAQDNRVLVKGIVLSDSIPIENVHILNKTSKEGTISNKKGEFKIFAKENDTLLFSDIQFYRIEIQISKQHLKSKYIIIDLLPKTNTLAEVELKAHDLTGNLTSDTKKFKDTVTKVNSALDFGSMDFSIPSLSVAKQLDPDKMPDPTDPNVPIGGDIIGLAAFILKPLTKEIKKIGKTKRNLKEIERIYQQNAKSAPEKIRIEFGDKFFMETLSISINQIDAFIIFCETKGIIDLYLKNKKIEMIDVFLAESKNFKNNE
ncbi:MAG: hypothetical protein ABFR32_03385 [Bacteroidota bacterium]